MTHKQQLTEELCTLPEIDKQIKELKFWTEYIDSATWLVFLSIWDTATWSIKIIWNPIEERHLRMYFKNKWIENIFINTDWKIFNWWNWVAICELDNTKPLSEQSEEVFEQILIALKGLNL